MAKVKSPAVKIFCKGCRAYWYTSKPENYICSICNKKVVTSK